MGGMEALDPQDPHVRLEWISEDCGLAAATVREISKYHHEQRELARAKGVIDALMKAPRYVNRGERDDHIRKLHYTSVLRVIHQGHNRWRPTRSIELELRRAVPIQTKGAKVIPLANKTIPTEIITVIGRHYVFGGVPRQPIGEERYDIMYTGDAAICASRCELGQNRPIRTDLDILDREILINDEQDIGFYNASATGVEGLRLLLAQALDGTHIRKIG